MAVPLFIPLARERAAAFRRAIDVCVSHYKNGSEKDNYGDLWTVLRSHAEHDTLFSDPLRGDVPLVVENALLWAAVRPLPPEEDLRTALALLKEGLADWSAAWMQVREIFKSSGRYVGPTNWVRDAMAIAMLRYRQAMRSLSEGWPLTSEDDERKALAEMRSGNAIELEEGFARITGTTKEAWLERVAKHRTHRGSRE